MPKCILIVDDSQFVRTALRRFLEEQLSFEVCGEAVDGLDAVEQAPKLNPDLIVLDFAMPRMNGLEAAKELRAKNIEAPIILFTMHSESILARQAREAGVNAVVSKTDLLNLKFEIEQLLEPA